MVVPTLGLRLDEAEMLRLDRLAGGWMGFARQNQQHQNQNISPTMESIHSFVLPGQVLATSNSETDGGFLRGHGTIEIVQDKDSDNRQSKAWGESNNENVVMQNDDDDASNQEDDAALKTGPQRLVASLAGTVQRVNKLISVIPISTSVYTGQVGDLKSSI